MRLYAETIREYPAAWEVPRAIAFALSNRAADATHALDYLRRIERDEAMVELNLQQTDSYYNSVSDVVRKYERRLRRAAPAECVWELFYLSRRAPYAAVKRLLPILQQRLREVSTPELHEFWRARLNDLSAKSGLTLACGREHG